MKQIVCIFFLGIFLFGCQNGESQLEKDTLVTDIFSPEEIESLDKLLSFVDRQIVMKTNIENVPEAYHTFFDTLHMYAFRREWNRMALEEKLRNDLYLSVTGDTETRRNPALFLSRDLCIRKIPRQAYLKYRLLIKIFLRIFLEWLQRIKK